ncbi:hypothetical protein AMS68_007416 [Peltaster fructicola]|uniref:Deacetylase sirtuin-type domain-containing protein n=1 Tax=Peltaster fructicola TaxID=286661 RepID=A0A6H0Y4Y5_9PEZI|nr:hypothetical protein AMS68_007416 [Peltaster fructicola]
MASSSTIPEEAMPSFHEHLLKSNKIMALCGAGLSAASGLPTFRGAGGLWRTHDATSLATEDAWLEDSGLVWQFYNYRRHMALQAKPNAAHYALAELARRKPGFQCLSQNVDGLSQRADHPRSQLQLLHGTLFNVKCDDYVCDYIREDFTDPFCPALATPTGQDPTTKTAQAAAQTAKELDISQANVPIPHVSRSDLPTCPKCKTGVLRPGVVWFGESLPRNVTNFVDEFIRQEDRIDLIMVIGTSAQVYPAAGYVLKARRKGTRVAVINMDDQDIPAGGGREGDWMFKGDASKIIPELLMPVVGKGYPHM